MLHGKSLKDLKWGVHGLLYHTSHFMLHGVRIWNRSPNVVVPASQGSGLSRDGDQRVGRRQWIEHMR